jgi:hypothetical protein
MPRSGSGVRVFGATTRSRYRRATT